MTEPFAFEPGATAQSGRVALVTGGEAGLGAVVVRALAARGHAVAIHAHAALGQALAIVSPLPQTTRDAILGVVDRDGAQLALLDTPGLHKPRSRLGKSMNASAREAARGADVVVYVTDVPAKHTGVLAVHPGDRTLLADVGEGVTTVLVVNKVDRLKNKADLLPLLAELGKLRAFAAIVPISAKREDGVELVLDEVARVLPEREALFPEDTLTDKPLRFFAAEYVREQLLRKIRDEIPHGVGVIVDSWESKENIDAIEMTDWDMFVEQLADGTHSFPNFRGANTSGRSAFTTTLQYVRASRGQFTFADRGTPWSTVARNLDIVVTRPTSEYRGQARFSNGTARDRAAENR